MATFKASQLTNIESSPAVRNPAADYDARKRVAVFTITDITGLVANDVIRLGALKKGWRLLGMKFVCAANWLAATATIILGTSGTTNKYMLVGTGVVGAAAVQLNGNDTAALGFGSVLAADEELQIVVGTAGAGSAPTSTAYVIVEYVRD